jgi:ADP-ribose pyrophosphatase YjhB (NUDIX family)
MKLFINNKRVKFISERERLKNKDYDVYINSLNHLDLNLLKGNVLIANAEYDQIKSFVRLLEMKKLDQLKTVTFTVNDVDYTELQLKNEYKTIKAAGGIVMKDGKLLLIHRLGVWDFPKGKLEANEPASDGAEREVFEECGVKAAVTEKIISTWHTYTDKEKKILKKTSWYLMDCLDDSQLKPQKEEDIDQVAWMTPDEADQALAGSYESIKYAFSKFLKMKVH